MKAVQLTGHGGLDKLVYREDVPIPEPSEQEVRIEVHACGMNNTDVWVRQGAYGTSTDPDAVSTWQSGEPTLEFPRVQGTVVGLACAFLYAHRLRDPQTDSPHHYAEYMCRPGTFS